MTRLVPLAALLPLVAVFPGVLGFDPTELLWAKVGNAVRCMAVPSGRVLRTIDLPESTAHVELSADGRRLAVRGWEAFAVRDTDPKAGWQVIETYPRRRLTCGSAQPPAPPLLGFTPDGSRLFTRRGVWGTDGRPELLTPDGMPAVGPVAFSPDGRRLAFRYVPNRPGYDGPANRDEWPAELRVWDAGSLEELGRVPLPAGVQGWTIDGVGRVWLSHPDTTLTAHPWDWAAFDRR